MLLLIFRPRFTVLWNSWPKKNPGPFGAGFLFRFRLV